MNSIPEVLEYPAPVVIITETTESWIALKAVYNITDYGMQFGIADRFLARALKDFAEAGIELAAPRLDTKTTSTLFEKSAETSRFP